MNLFLIDNLIKQAEEACKAGNYIKAKKAYLKLYKLFEHIFGKNDLDTLKIRGNLATTYANLGDDNTALEMRKEVYNELKEALGEKHSDTLVALANLAISYSELGNYTKALELQNIVYDARKDILGEKHLSTLNALDNIAKSYSNLGNYTEALKLTQVVYNAKKELLGKYDLETLSCLNSLASSYRGLGEYRKALNIKNELYDVVKKVLGEKDINTLITLMNLAHSYTDLGYYNEALKLNKAAYVAINDIYGENNPDTLSALSSLASSYIDLGDYKKALELESKVYKERKQLLGENHQDTLSSLGCLADIYSDLGEYRKGLELSIEVFRARKLNCDENNPHTIRALGCLTNAYSKFGDYRKAFELASEFYDEMKLVHGENHPDTLRALGDLADAYGNLGDYHKALDLETDVYNATKEILGENHPNTLMALGNLANCYTDIGNYAKAIELLTELYEVRLKIWDERHPYVLRTQNNLAILYCYTGNYSKSVALSTKVYNTQKVTLGENHPDTLGSLNNLAMAYKDLKNNKMALELYNIAYEEMKHKLGENHSTTLLVLNGLISTLVHGNIADEEVLKKHMIAYFENINNLKMIAFNIKEVSSRRNFLKSFNRVYKLLKTSVFERKIYDLLDYLFINKNLSFEIDVSRFRDEAMSERLSLEEVSHAIGNYLIIDFYELDNSMYGIILIKEEKHSNCVVHYENIGNGSFIDDKDLQSFIGSLEDYDHIYICPDGELYNISFERVFNCSNISYLSSVQTLFKKNTDDDSNDQLVSFVYPDFSGKLSDDNDRGDKKGVLYGSYLEGIFIHDIYAKKSTIYSSYQVSHDNFLETKRPRILHVSTHGEYLDNEHMEPMDRGILCLSGYNLEENNSGYISAREIQYMDLKGTELAVLSACNTGLGGNISGEGIYGIRRAFELAGCQTLLLTVEEVDDFNSAIFMKSFYERYNQTNNIYQSFKDTKEYLKEYGLKELKELRDVFEKEMKNKINSRIVYRRNLNELNKRVEESGLRGQIVRKKDGEYVIEDWNGFIIQGKIEN